MAFIDNDEYIYVKQNSLSSEICDKIIYLFENELSEFVMPGTTINNTSVTDVKKTFDLVLNATNNIYDERMFLELNTNMVKYFHLIEDRYSHCSGSDGMIKMANLNDSGFQVQKYNRGEGYYKYHNDYCISDNKLQHRMIAFIWYLNTVYEGGETEFFNGKVSIKPEKGKLLLFPAAWTYPHRGNMPISSDKYIVTGWIYSDI
jgi:hypothetical protein